MKPNLNSKGGQGHKEEPNQPLNQSFQGGSEKISYMNSNGSSRNCCKVPNKNLIGHVLGGQNGGSTFNITRNKGVMIINWRETGREEL